MYTSPTVNPILGNHVGTVISDEDPEGRGRLQVWVPYLSLGLYDNWNSVSKDVTITNDITQLPIDIERLRKHLPWAEPAWPTFGFGGTTRVDKKTGATIPRHSNAHVNSAPLNLNRSNNSDVNRVALSNPETPSNPSGNTLLPGSSIQTSTYGPYLNSTLGEVGESNPDLNSLLGIGAGSNILRENGDGVTVPFDVATNQSMRNFLGQSTNHQVNYGDVFEINGYKVRIADTGGKTNKNFIDFYTTDTSTTSASKKSAINSIARGITSVKYLESDKTPMSGELKNWIGNASTRSTFGSLLGDRGYRVYSSGGDGNASYVGGKLNQGETFLSIFEKIPGFNDIKQYTSFANIPASSGGNVASKPSASSSANAPVSPGAVIDGKKVDPVAHHGISKTNLKTPQGIFSTPAVGNLVWVFFYGGDVQRPVYFASVTEPNVTERISGGAISSRSQPLSGSSGGGGSGDKLENDEDEFEKVFSSLPPGEQSAFYEAIQAGSEYTDDGNTWHRDAIEKFKNGSLGLGDTLLSPDGDKIYPVYIPDSDGKVTGTFATSKEIQAYQDAAPPDLKPFYNITPATPPITLADFWGVNSTDTGAVKTYIASNDPNRELTHRDAFVAGLRGNGIVGGGSSFVESYTKGGTTVYGSSGYVEDKKKTGEIVSPW